MPVYEYECQGCRHIFEVQQKIADSPIETCPECQGEVKKLMSMTSFQLKGGGWYADGYSSAAANGKNGSGTGEKAAENPAPACGSSSPKCAGCPAAAAN